MQDEQLDTAWSNPPTQRFLFLGVSYKHLSHLTTWKGESDSLRCDSKNVKVLSATRLSSWMTPQQESVRLEKWTILI